MSACRYPQLLIDGNYASMALRRPLDPAEFKPYSPYLAVRSLLILGRYGEANDAIHELATCLAATGTLDFLKRQLKVFTSQASKVDANALAAIAESSEVTFDDLYLCGEAHLMCGFAFSRLNDFRQALKHNRLAVKYYREAELPTCESVALFNTAVACNHLNMRASYELAIAELGALARRHTNPTVQLAHARLAGNLAVDQEDFAVAVFHFGRAVAMARQEGRFRDLGGLAIALIYATARLEAPEFDQTIALLEQLRPGLAHLTPGHSFVIEQFQLLVGVAFVGEDQLVKWLKIWQEQGIESVNIIFLLGVGLLQLQRSEDYHGLLTMARKLGVLARASEQAASLIDARFFEAMALWKLGAFAEAESVALSLLADALERQAPAKEVRARGLLMQVRQGLGNDKTAARGGQEITSREPLLLILSNHTQALLVNGREQSLRDKPMLSKLLNIVIADGPVTLGYLFEQLYGNAYRPTLHERRLHSLMERLRKIIGDRHALIRRDGRVSLASHVKALVQGEHYRADDIAVRRRLVLAHIDGLRRPQSIKDITVALSAFARRTLQTDLAALAKAGLISIQGEKRGRLYGRPCR